MKEILSAEKFHEILNGMPELKDKSISNWDIYDMNPLLDSSNMDVEDWNRIGDIIDKNYDGYDGFVVLHGTDTMAYTASALSFMLENLGKPVILTGSQIPISELRSDGKDNLIAALMIVASKKVSEVCIYFRGELLRGNRANKYSADGFFAFKSPNFPKLAVSGKDMTTEAAVAKLYYLFSKDYDYKTICTFMETNLRGERT